jgi:hypothetical protein
VPWLSLPLKLNTLTFHSPFVFEHAINSFLSLTLSEEGGSGMVENSRKWWEAGEVYIMRRNFLTCTVLQILSG